MDVLGFESIEESYERQGYRMGIPKQVYVSRVLANIRKRDVGGRVENIRF